MYYLNFGGDTCVDGMELYYKYCLSFDLGHLGQYIELFSQENSEIGLTTVEDIVDLVFHYIKGDIPNSERYFIAAKNSFRRSNKYGTQYIGMDLIEPLNIRNKEELDDMDEKIENYLKEDVLLLVVLALIEVVFQEDKNSVSLSHACEKYAQSMSVYKDLEKEVKYINTSKISAENTSKTFDSKNKDFFDSVYNNSLKNVFAYINTPFLNLIGGMLPDTRVQKK